jgi:hypothetical protein
MTQQKARRRDGAREPVQKTRHFEEKIFDEWPLKNGDRMRVSVNYFAGYDIVHIRCWQRRPNGRLYPTEKGAAIGIGQLPRVLKALRTVRTRAREIGLLPPSSRSR